MRWFTIAALLLGIVIIMCFIEDSQARKANGGKGSSGKGQSKVRKSSNVRRVSGFGGASKSRQKGSKGGKGSNGSSSGGIKKGGKGNKGRKRSGSGSGGVRKRRQKGSKGGKGSNGSSSGGIKKGGKGNKGRKRSGSGSGGARKRRQKGSKGGKGSNGSSSGGIKKGGKGNKGRKRSGSGSGGVRKRRQKGSKGGKGSNGSSSGGINKGGKGNKGRKRSGSGSGGVRKRRQKGSKGGKGSNGSSSGGIKKGGKGNKGRKRSGSGSGGVRKRRQKGSKGGKGSNGSSSGGIKKGGKGNKGRKRSGSGSGGVRKRRQKGSKGGKGSNGSSSGGIKKGGKGNKGRKRSGSGSGGVRKRRQKGSKGGKGSNGSSSGGIKKGGKGNKGRKRSGSGSGGVRKRRQKGSKGGKGSNGSSSGGINKGGKGNKGRKRSGSGSGGVRKRRQKGSKGGKGSNGSSSGGIKKGGKGNKGRKRSGSGSGGVRKRRQKGSKGGKGSNGSSSGGIKKGGKGNKGRKRSGSGSGGVRKRRQKGSKGSNGSSSGGIKKGGKGNKGRKRSGSGGGRKRRKGKNRGKGKRKIRRRGGNARIVNRGNTKNCKKFSKNFEHGERFLSQNCKDVYECNNGKATKQGNTSCGKNARCDKRGNVGKCKCNKNFFGNPEENGRLGCSKLKASECGKPFRVVGGYLCLMGSTGRLNMRQARRFCNRQGGKVFTPENLDECKLIGRSNGLPRIAGKVFWVGGLKSLADDNILDDIIKNYKPLKELMSGNKKRGKRSKTRGKISGNTQSSGKGNSFNKGGKTSSGKGKSSNKSGKTTSGKGKSSNKRSKTTRGKAKSSNKKKPKGFRKTISVNKRTRTSSSKRNKGTGKPVKTIRAFTDKEMYGSFFVSSWNKYSSLKSNNFKGCMRRLSGGAQTFEQVEFENEEDDDDKTNKIRKLGGCLSMSVNGADHVNLHFAKCSHKHNVICQKTKNVDSSEFYWTDWYDTSTWKYGEYESVAKTIELSKDALDGSKPVCANPIDMRCRIKSSKELINAENTRGFELSIPCENGEFKCKNSKNDKDCPDVEVRFNCKLDFDKCSVESNRKKCDQRNMMCQNQASGGHKCVPPTCKSENKVCFDMCKEAKLCKATGDPHYLTLDGNKYNFQGDCTYVLIRSDDDSGLTPFTVKVNNYKKKTTAKVSYTRWVSLDYKGHEYKLDFQRKLFVDDTLTCPPYQADDGVSVEQCGNNLVIKTEFGLEIRYNGMHNAYVLAAMDLRDQVEGLCGNFNNDADDDLHLRADIPQTPGVSQADNFGNSWATYNEDDDGKECHIAITNEECSEADKQKIKDDKQTGCGNLFGTDSKFKKAADDAGCLDKFNEAAENCVYDLCLAGEGSKVRCEMFTEIAQMIEDNGIEVENWRELTNCHVQCHGDKQPTKGAKVCEATCSDMTPTCLESEPDEVCRCPEGLVVDADNSCVEIASCGCIYGNMYIQTGSSIVTQGCKQKITCTVNLEGFPEIEESSFECHEFATCKGRKCKCQSGYSGDGVTTCDIDPSNIKCPKGFKKTGKKCYTTLNKKVTWQDAALDCASLLDGSELARYDTDEDKTFLTEAAKRVTGVLKKSASRGRGGRGRKHKKGKKKRNKSASLEFWIGGNSHIPRKGAGTSQLDPPKLLVNDLQQQGCFYGKIKEGRLKNYLDKKKKQARHYKHKTQRRRRRKNKSSSKRKRQNKNSTKKTRKNKSSSKRKRQNKNSTKKTRKNKSSSKRKTKNKSSTKKTRKNKSSSKRKTKNKSSTKKTRKNKSSSKSKRQNKNSTKKTRKNKSSSKSKRQNKNSTKKTRKNKSSSKSKTKNKSSTKKTRKNKSSSKSKRQNKNSTKKTRKNKSSSKSKRQNKNSTKKTRKNKSSSKSKRQNKNSTKKTKKTKPRRSNKNKLGKINLQIKVTSNCNHKKNPVCEFDPVKFSERPVKLTNTIRAIKGESGSALTLEQARQKDPSICKNPSEIVFSPNERTGDSVTNDLSTGFKCIGPCRSYIVGFKCPEEVNECDREVTGTNACSGGKECQNTYNHFICKCPAGTELNKKKGNCKSRNECSCSGDPHCMTYYGHKIDFMGKCKYLISGTCKDVDSNQRKWKVECKNTKCGKSGKDVTCTTYCDTTISQTGGNNPEGEDVIRMERDGVLTVNGAPEDDTDTINGITVSVSGKQSTLTTDFGLKVVFDGRSRIYIYAPDGYKGKLCGICGDVTAEGSYSYELGGDTDAAFEPEFKSNKNKVFKPTSALNYGNSWQVNDPVDENCQMADATFEGCSDAKSEELKGTGKCGRMQSLFEEMQQEKTSLSTKQINNLNPDTNIESCITDACAQDEGSEKVICDAVADYAKKLFENTDFKAYWRTSDFCQITCGKNEKLEMYAKCDRNCGESSSVLMTCDGVVNDRCICKNSYRRKGKKCVLPKKCKCKGEFGTGELKSTFKIDTGETGLNGDCSKKISCTDGQIVEVETITMDANSECKLVDGKPKIVCNTNYEMNSDNKCIFQGSCEKPYEQVGERCLFASTEFMPWRAAIRSCNAIGGHLVNINSEDFKSTLQSKYDSNNYWIAGFNSDTDDDQAGYENYKLPIGLDKDDSSTAKCVALEDDAFVYKDCKSDSIRLKYICESYPDTSKTITTNDCNNEEPDQDGNEVETVLGIQMANPSCICSRPKNVMCSADGQDVITSDTITCGGENGELLNCQGTKDVSCSDHKVKGDCPPNFDECANTEVVTELCGDGTCTDEWGAFKCSCDSGKILVNGICEDVSTCELNVEESDNTFKVVTFDASEYSKETGDCTIKLLDCVGLVITAKKNDQNFKVLTIEGDCNIVLTEEDNVEAVDNVRVNDDSVTTFPNTCGGYTIDKYNNEIIILSNDKKFQISLNDEFLFELRILSSECINGACSSNDADEIFSNCNDVDTGASTGSGTGQSPASPESPEGPEGTQPPPPPQQTPPPPPPQQTPPSGPGPENPPNPSVPQGTQPAAPPTQGLPPPPPQGPENTPGPTAEVPNPELPTQPSPPPAGEDQCSEDMKADNKCGIISESAGPFAACLNTDDIFDLCVRDVCLEEMDICDALKKAQQTCTGHSLTKDEIVAYKMEAECEEECPENMLFSFTPPVTATCKNKNPVTPEDTPSPSPGCYCKPGFYMEEKTCIKDSECGCVKDGVYHELDDVWFSDGCTTMFACKSGSTISQQYTLIDNSKCGEVEEKPYPICSEGFMGVATELCNEVEEKEDSYCADVPDGDSTKRVCLCKKGFVSDCESCVDLDECQTGLAKCGANEKCVNLRGNFTCECAAGYERGNIGLCININECQKPGMGKCQPNSKCIDVPGKYTCACCYGYKAVPNSFSEFRYTCQRDPEIINVGNDCCICNTADCKPPSNGNPSHVCGTDGVDYDNYKQLYELNCAKNGEANIGVGIATFGSCPKEASTTTTSTTTSTTTTTTPKPVQICDSSKICSQDELNTDVPCCNNGNRYKSFCDMRMSMCTKNNVNPDLTAAACGICFPVTKPPTTTPVPTPSEDLFEAWKPWSECAPRPSGLPCGTANGVKFRIRKFIGTDTTYLTSEMVRQQDSCDLHPCPADTPQPEVSNPCNDEDCPRVEDPYCGKIIGLDDKPITYTTRCHLERMAKCQNLTISKDPNDYYPGNCSPGGTRPLSLPCKKGPFRIIYSYNSPESTTGTTCSADNVEIGTCQTGACAEGTNDCCKAVDFEEYELTVTCVNIAQGRIEKVAKKVHSAVKCDCVDKDD